MENNYQPFPLTPYPLKPLKKTNQKFKRNIPISPIISKRSIRLASSNQNTPPPLPTPIQPETNTNPFMHYVRRFGTEFGSEVVKGAVAFVFVVGFSVLLPFLYQFNRFKEPILFLRDHNLVVFDETKFQEDSVEKKEKEGLVSYGGAKKAKVMKK